MSGFLTRRKKGLGSGKITNSPLPTVIQIEFVSEAGYVCHAKYCGMAKGHGEAFNSLFQRAKKPVIRAEIRRASGLEINKCLDYGYRL
jgi:hypothetical protein